MEKKIIFGTLAGAITSFCLGGLVFGFLLKDLMAEWMTGFLTCRHIEPPMVPIFIANIISSLLLALYLQKSSVSTLMGGLKAGGLFFLLLYLWFDLWMFASFTGMTTQLMAIDTAANTLIGAITGGVVVWIFGKVSG
jgi:hypothetical protein